jgi:outer membrane protein assembly factor BamB
MRLRAFLVAVLALVTCAGVVAVGETPAAAATPVVTLGSLSGQPGSTVLVRGGGFTAGAAVDIYFDTTDEALAIANGLGTFTNVPVSVPASAAPGIHYVSAIARASGLGGQAQFVVSTDWPQYRDGARHHGYNSTENVLSASNVSGIDVAWSAATGNSIDSSPAVVTQVTGSKSGPPMIHSTVYVGSTDDNVYALNATTGATVWSFATGGEVESSPAVVNGVVYVGSDDGNVYALNATNGTEKWSFTIGSPVSSPAVAGGVVYAASENGDVHALNATTGAQLWNFVTDESLGSSPSVANGKVYIGAGGTVYAINAATGAQVWSNNPFDGSPVGGSTAVAYGKVYVAFNDGDVVAFNAATGAQVWSTLTESEASATSPAVANGVVYFGSSDGNVYAFSAFTGNQLWSSPIGSVLESSPAVANGVLYIGSTDNNVYAFSAATGAQLWTFATGNLVRSSPTVANGVLYAASLDNSIYAFDLAGGTAAVMRPAVSRPVLSRLRPNYTLRPQQGPRTKQIGS